MFANLLPLLQKICAYLLPFIQKKVEQVAETPAQAPAPELVKAVEEPVKPAGIDWSDPSSRINKRFSVKDATYLPSWGVSHLPSVEQKLRIVDVATRIDHLLDKLEIQLDKKLVVDVHVFIRPGVASCPGTKWDGLDYNSWLYHNVVWKGLSEEEKAKKTVPNSPHKLGNAVDFHLVGYAGAIECGKMRELMVPLLAEFGLRVEDHDGSWIHLDSNKPGLNPDGTERRKFKP